MTDPGLPLTTGEGTGLDKTPAELLAEMRAFALTLPDDLGPLFGRDVARMCDECGRLREQLDAARQALDDIFAFVMEARAALGVEGPAAGPTCEACGRSGAKDRLCADGEVATLCDSCVAALSAGVEGPAG